MAATEPTFTIETIVDMLRGARLRITKSRLGIVKALFRAEAPMTLQEIQGSAAAQGEPEPDYATVFRTITVMERLRLVHKVNLQRPCSYYELNDPRKHYDHLVCKTCGDVVLLDIPCPLRDAERNIAHRYGFRELSHSLEFFGVCPDCAHGPPASRVVA